MDQKQQESNVYYIIYFSQWLAGTAQKAVDGMLFWTNRLYDLGNEQDQDSLKKIEAFLHEVAIKVEEVTLEITELPRLHRQMPQRVLQFITTASL